MSGVAINASNITKNVVTLSTSYIAQRTKPTPFTKAVNETINLMKDTKGGNRDGRNHHQREAD